MRTARARPSRWHLLEVLKPQVPVKRMVFHEITRSAIEHAVDDCRDIDYGLVDAQESRRIVDRLFGYPVSEVCWRKIKPGPVGRPGAVAGRAPRGRAGARAHGVRRRRLLGPRRRLPHRARPSPPGSSRVDGSRVAGSRDFDSLGRTKRDDVVVLDEAAAQRPADGLDGQPVHASRRSRPSRTRRSRSRRSSPRRSSRWAAAGCA